jgi:hypothetical protein
MIDALPLLLSPEGYQISRSVRLRSSASAYFNRTPGSGGNRQKFTLSVWVKRGSLGGTQNLINVHSSTSGADGIRIDADKLNFYCTDATNANLATTAVFRDPSAWYHIVFAIDTTQATSTNRVRVYVNSIEQTSFSTSTYPTQNFNTSFNEVSRATSVGRNQPYANEYFDGYMAEFNWIDGQQLTPASFGETDAVTGVWKPKKYAGTYGTNGFYLNFSDNTGATATTIGADYSGNGNNWTPNNISVTAGVTYDSMLDVPTQWADGGNGRGNYATWNPIDHPTTFIAPTNGNLSQNCNTAAWTLCVPTFAIPDGSGLWQWELVQTGTANGANAIGVCLTTVQASVTGAPSSRAGCSGVDNVGTTFINGVTSGSITYPTVGNTITCLYDATNRTLQVFDNGTSRGTITGLPAGDVRPFVAASSSNGSPTFVANFGQTPFSYNQGGKALNTLNLPIPTILKGNQYFDATTYTGTGASLNVVNSGGMQPDFVWTKPRSTAVGHTLFDSLRGVTKYLQSNTTGAEGTAATSLTSFNSDGFTVNSDTSTGANGVTYVGWQWKEGPTQGFDIVTYTGTGSNTTVAHSLGVAPSMMIVKRRNASDSWPVYHSKLTSAANTLILNSTAAQQTVTTYWNSTAPTSSVFTISTDSAVNASGSTYVAYLFSEVAGFSRMGSYVGNGSADGPFCFTGFLPRFILLKNASAATNWRIHDTARDPENTSDAALYPNSSSAEDIGFAIDILSNGFKLRATDSGSNGNGNTIIFAAFASNPFKNALAR